MSVRIEEIGQEIYRLETPIQGIDITFSVYLIDGLKPVLIEPGPAAAAPGILEGLRKLAINDVSYIIPTHIHTDHAGGMGRLAKLFPSAQVVLHPRALRHATDPSRLVKGAREVLGDDVMGLYGEMLPVHESQAKVVADRISIDLCTRTLRIFHAPGHAPHHIAVMDQQTRTLFCGEALGIPIDGEEPFALPTVAPPHFDMGVYLDTIRRLKELKPLIVAYSHDGVKTDWDQYTRSVTESTRILGGMILKAVRNGDSILSIDLTIRQYIAQKTGLIQNHPLLGTLLDGYMTYFKKIGII